MLLIHEFVRLACSIAAGCFYTCIYIVHAFSFIDICPFQEEQELLDHQRLMKIFWNHYHLSVLSFSLLLSCLKAQRKKKTIYLHTHIHIYMNTPIYAHTHIYQELLHSLFLRIILLTGWERRTINSMCGCYHSECNSVLRLWGSEEGWEHEEREHLFY